MTRITDDGVAGIATDCRKLVDIKVETSDVITDASLCAVFQACTKLTSVELKKSTQITDRAITTLIQHRRALKRLVLFENTRLTERSITAMVTFPTALETLCITHMPVTDDSMVLLSRYCAPLKSITIMHCNLLSIRTVEALVANYKNLRSLIMLNCTHTNRTPELTAYLRSADIAEKIADGVHIMIV